MTGLSQNRAKQIRALHQKKYRQESGLFLVEGAKAVYETMEEGWPCESLVCTEKFLKASNKATEFFHQEILICSEDQLSTLGNFQTNNAALLIARQKSPELMPDPDQKLWIALDEISDPGNLGTIIRLADWFGLKEVICLGNCVEWYNPKVISSTMGSFLRIQKVVAEPDWLKSADRPWFAADLSGQNLYDFRFPGRSTLVIGSESNGLSEEWIQKNDSILSIPSFGKAESLNAAIATGIFLNHWRLFGI
jgi:RNA methyltransferase, TrmH family